MMNSITKSLNIVTILTKQRSKDQFFYLCFVKIVTIFKLLVILFIIANLIFNYQMQQRHN